VLPRRRAAQDKVKLGQTETRRRGGAGETTRTERNSEQRDEGAREG
jgi:hypothetical protein